MSQPGVTSSHATAAILALDGDVTMALAARRRTTVVSRAVSARRAATSTATRSAPLRSAAPTDETTPACVSCVEPPAAS